MNVVTKRSLLQRRKWRIRKTVAGTSVRPRLSLKVTGKHLYAQAIDDERGVTLAFLATVSPDFRPLLSQLKQSELAKELGSRFAATAKAAGVTRVVFDRNGRLYHGNVAAFAEAARAGGLDF